MSNAPSTVIETLTQAFVEHPETTESTVATRAIEYTPIVTGLDVMSIVIAAVIGYIGVLIMVYGSLVSFWQFICSARHAGRNLPMIRVNLGKHLALGLEFLVGKDIVESIVSPTWDDLGKLGAIIVLRTIVTIFLSRELKEVEEELNLEEWELRLEQKRHAAQA